MNTLLLQNSLNMSNFSIVANIVSFIMVIGMIMVARHMFKNSEGVDSVDKFFTDGFIHKLKTIALLSTTTECIGLMILAFARGIDPFNAIIRYTIFGFIELACTYIFIDTSNRFQNFIINRTLADEKIDFLEIGWIIPYAIVILPLFLILSIPTWIIAQLYFESTGALRLVFGGTSFLPWEQVQVFETGKHTFVELGALVVIYVTPIISIIQIVVAPILKIRDRLDKINNDDDDDDDDDNFTSYDNDLEEDINTSLSTYNDLESSNPSMKNVLKGASEILNVSEVGLYDNLQQVLGKSGSSTTTNPEIALNKKTTEEVEISLKSLLLGSTEEDNPNGILGYKMMENKLRVYTSKNHDLLQDINQIHIAINNCELEEEKNKLKSKLRELESDKMKSLNDIKRLSRQKLEIKKSLEENCKFSGIYPGTGNKIF